MQRKTRRKGAVRVSKYANPGELRTTVYFFRTDRVTDDENVAAEKEINVFGESKSVKCKWVNTHGTETFAAMQLQLREPATITCRFSPLINSRLIAYKESDPEPYEVISVDDVENRHQWLEIKVQRKEAAR